MVPKANMKTGDKSISYTRRCRGSAFTCTDEINPYFPTLAGKLAKAIHFERDPKHLRGISPKCIDCIDPTWNRLATANMQRPAANFSFQGRRSLTTWNPGMWETHISETFVERNCNQLRHFALLSSCWPRIVRIVDQMWYIRTSPFCSETSWNKPRSKPLMDLLNRAESFACSESSLKKWCVDFGNFGNLCGSFHVHSMSIGSSIPKMVPSISIQVMVGLPCRLLMVQATETKGEHVVKLRWTCTHRLARVNAHFSPTQINVSMYFWRFPCFLAYFALQSRNFRTRQKSTRTSPSNPTKQ